MAQVPATLARCHRIQRNEASFVLVTATKSGEIHPIDGGRQETPHSAAREKPQGCRDADSRSLEQWFSDFAIS